jgi:integrase
MRLSYICKPVKDTNEVYIILRYHYHSTQTDFSTGIKCEKRNWTKRKSSSPIKSSEPNFIEKNEILRLFNQKVEQVIFNIKTNSQEPTGQLVKRNLKVLENKTIFKSQIEDSVNSYSIQFLMDEYLKSIKLGNQIADYKSNKYRIGLIKSFIVDKYKEELFVHEINEDFCQLMFEYLFNKKLSNSTSVKVYHQLKILLNWSFKRKYISPPSLNYKHNLNTSYKEILSLTLEQLKVLFTYKGFDYGDSLDVSNFKSWNGNEYLIKEQKIVSVRDENKKIKRNKKFEIETQPVEGMFHYWTTYEVIKDMFLFSCSTGLRYSDLVRMRIENFDYDKKVFPIIQKKTQKPVKIIENPLSKYIFKKYSKGRTSKEYLFPLNCKSDEKSRDNYNTKCNKHLKEIFGKLDISKPVVVRKIIGRNSPEEVKPPLSSVISFHVGRKTYSTIANMIGIDPFSLSSQMGHQGLEMTRNYVKVYDSKLKSMFDFIEEEDKEDSKPKNNTDMKKPNDSSLESKLEYLKSMKDKGMITDEIYSNRVSKLLEENGF